MLAVHELCRRCACDDLERITAEGGGTILSHTAVYADPTGKRFARPRLLAVIQLAEGPTLMAFLTKKGKRAPVIGDPVVLDRVAGNPPRYTFRVVPGRQPPI